MTRTTRTSPLCQYCGAAPAIPRSHVVPRFVFRYIQDNSPTGELLYSWHRRFEHDQIVGPYLCAHHDNDVFQSWETYFCNNLFRSPLTAGAHWHAEPTVRFALSLCFRYALHHLHESPHNANTSENVFFKDISKASLDDIDQVGKKIYLYPFVIRPILASCDFINRINSFVFLSVHGHVFPLADDLPTVFVARICNICFVFSTEDLAAISDTRVAELVDLRPGVPFDPNTANAGLLTLLTSYFNTGIGQTMAHQKSLGWWRKYLIGRDMIAHPDKMVYQASRWDGELDRWQRANCR